MLRAQPRGTAAGGSALLNQGRRAHSVPRQTPVSPGTVGCFAARRHPHRQESALPGGAGQWTGRGLTVQVPQRLPPLRARLAAIHRMPFDLSETRACRVAMMGGMRLRLPIALVLLLALAAGCSSGSKKKAA